MAIKRFFEVHQYVGGKWELTALCDDKESALAEARMLVDNARTPVGVRVLRVVSREDNTGEVAFDEQTIFRHSPVDEHGPEGNANVTHAWQDVEAARGKRRLERLRDRTSRTPTDPLEGSLKLILQLTVAAGAAVVAMVLLHEHFFF